MALGESCVFEIIHNPPWDIYAIYFLKSKICCKLQYGRLLTLFESVLNLFKHF